MKRKSRFFATALATAMCATSIIGLVACSKDAGDLPGELGGDPPVDPGVYTVTLDANGGSFASSAVKTTYTTTNGKITEALPTAAQVAREHYTFDGWYTAQTGGTAVSITTFTVTADGTTLYAHWNPVQQQDPEPNDSDDPPSEIIITFNANGGTLVGEGTATAVDGKVAASPTATRDGYEFLGWGEEEEMSSPIDFTVKTFTASQTLYAQWGEEQGGGEQTSRTDMVAVQGGNQDEQHPNVYLLVGTESGVDKTQGYFVAYSGEDYGASQFTITKELYEGEVVAIFVPAWQDFLCAVIENTGIDDTASNITIGTETYIKINRTGTYTFYFKSMYGGDKIWISWGE